MMWKSEFSRFSFILEILEIESSIIPRILERLEIEISIIPMILEMRAGGGRLQGLCCAALVYFWNIGAGKVLSCMESGNPSL